MLLTILMTNPFFKNYGPLNIKDIYKVFKINNDKKIIKKLKFLILLI